MKFLLTLSLLLPLALADLPGDRRYFWSISTKKATSHPQPKPPSLTQRHQSTLDPPNNYFLFATPEHTYARPTTPAELQKRPRLAATLQRNKNTVVPPGPGELPTRAPAPQGDEGLLTFTVLVGPSRDEGPTADMIPKDTPTEWSVFQIGERYQGGELSVRDGQGGEEEQKVDYF